MSRSVLTLDIGGTFVKYGVFSDGEEFGQFAVAENGREDVPGAVARFAAAHPAEHIAVSMPGPADYTVGAGRMTHKLPSLYGVDLRSMIAKVCPDSRISFCCDSTSFALGVMAQWRFLEEETFGCVMLGTGLGYTYLQGGRVVVNSGEMPYRPMWCRPCGDGIVEQVVSGSAIAAGARAAGYDLPSVKAIAEAARAGDPTLRQLFTDAGQMLGRTVQAERADVPLSHLAVGGQMSLSWDLMAAAFSAETDIPVLVVPDPHRRALYGLLEFSERGKDNLYIFGEDK